MHAHELKFETLKKHLWPFTSSFLSKNPELLAGIIFLIDGSFKGKDYVSIGANRLLDTHIFCKYSLEKQYNSEKIFWREFVNRLEKFRDFNSNLKSLISSTKI